MWNLKQSCSLLLGDVLLAMLMLPLIMHLKIQNSFGFSFNGALGGFFPPPFFCDWNIYLSKLFAVAIIVAF